MIGANGQARLVTAHAAGKLTVGPPARFEGERSGIAISQLNPAVPERLAGMIATRGGVPTSGLARFVMVSLPHDLVGWDIYPSAGDIRFRARLRGGSLQEISPSGTRALG